MKEEKARESTNIGVLACGAVGSCLSLINGSRQLLNCVWQRLERLREEVIMMPKRESSASQSAEPGWGFPELRCPQLFSRPQEGSLLSVWDAELPPRWFAIQSENLRMILKFFHGRCFSGFYLQGLKSGRLFPNFRFVFVAFRLSARQIQLEQRAIDAQSKMQRDLLKK